MRWGNTAFFEILALFLACSSFASTPVTLDDVVQKVSSENYEVLESALRVYQAKETIEVVRGNLLPQLNFWKMIGIAYDWKSTIGMIEDIAPFLVPANWFRFQETELLFLAEKEGYRSLWANELMTAKALYFHSLFDRAVLEHIKRNIQEFETLSVIVRARELLGGIPDGASRDLQTRILSLREDQRSMEVLVHEETTMLAFMMGLPTEVDLVISPQAMPPFEEFQPLNYSDFEFRVLDSSSEVRQYGYLVETAALIKNEVKFSFLGGSSQSRGVAGGVLDGIPDQMAFGFGTGPSMRIVDSQKKLLELQKKAIIETLKRQLKILIANYNLDLANYSDQKRHVELTKKTLDQLYLRLNLGEEVEILALVEASRNYIQADTAFFEVQYRFLLNSDKLRRLLFQGDYHREPAAVEWIRGSEAGGSLR